MKRNVFSILLLLCSIVLYSSNDVEKLELKQTYKDAEYFYLYEKYNKALESYQKILELEPSNSNIHYKIGLCYLQFQKEGFLKEALHHFEYSIKNVSSEYKNTYRESKAPHVTWLYYGDVLRLSYRFDEAIVAYQKYLELASKNNSHKSYIQREIRNCKIAPELVEQKVYLTELKHKYEIEKKGSFESCPVVSSNEQILVFAYGEQNILPPDIISISEMDDYKTDDIYFSQNTNGAWQKAINITIDLGTNGKALPTSISSEGDILYIAQDDKDNGNIYTSNLNNGVWSKIEKLNKNVNSRAWETYASISKDNKTLYFASDRKGGYGGFDIYKSEMDAEGEWGKAENLGENINTEYDEDTPNITRDGDVLYFSSQGHKNMGGYDIFQSTFIDGNWKESENVGYPLNTPGNDLFVLTQFKGQIVFAPLNDDKLRGFSDFDDSDLFLVSKEEPLFEFIATVNIVDQPNVSPQGITVDTSNLGIKNITIKDSLITFNSPRKDFDLIVSANQTDTAILSIVFNENDKSSDTKYLEINLQGQPLASIEKETNIPVINEIREVYFSFDKSFVQTKFTEDVKAIYQAWLLDKTQNILVEGYADPIGAEAYNLRLSQRRADAIKQALLEMGVAKDKISSIGKGETSENSNNYYNRKTVISFTK